VYRLYAFIEQSNGDVAALHDRPRDQPARRAHLPSALVKRILPNGLLVTLALAMLPGRRSYCAACGHGSRRWIGRAGALPGPARDGR
jgi:hypothetical protein